MRTKKLVPYLMILVLALSSLACTINKENIPELPKLPQLFPATATAQNPNKGVEQHGSSTILPTSQAPSGPIPTALPAEPLQGIGGATADLQAELQQVYKNALPGVVMIRFTSGQNSGEGTGFVIDKEGHIVTNYHVAGEVSSLEVDFADGSKVEGTTIGLDLDSDLAVVKVNVPADKLHPLPLGDSDQAAVGTIVVAIGSPYGLGGTMTMGIISAHGRTLDSLRQSGQADQGAALYFAAGDLLQTDASINPGNSGGPLLNLQGQVIGVNRAIQTAGVSLSGQAVNTGIGFAVSSNIVRKVVPSLIEKGSYAYPYLGLSAMSDGKMSLALAKEIGLAQASGAYVVAVTAGGPADKAGINAANSQTGKGGDLIIAIDGKPVITFSDLLSYLILNKNPGDSVNFTVLRGSKQIEVPLVVGARP
ncbi:MAG: trypsin-like peptidase domain-containing protein [Anaerolineaceae bacterium]|nr:trypsin-like peptidase domain-containing protein [Anaerolineaceae bacterium]